MALHTKAHNVDMATMKCLDCGMDMLSPEVAPAPTCSGKKPTLSVVTKLREEPPLTDIPGHLERLAKQIREGKRAPVHGVLVLKDADGHVAVFEHGRSNGIHDTHGMLSHAQMIVSGHFKRGGGRNEMEDGSSDPDNEGRN